MKLSFIGWFINGFKC